MKCGSGTLPRSWSPAVGGREPRRCIGAAALGADHQIFERHLHTGNLARNATTHPGRPRLAAGNSRDGTAYVLDGEPFGGAPGFRGDSRDLVRSGVLTPEPNREHRSHIGVTGQCKQNPAGVSVVIAAGTADHVGIFFVVGDPVGDVARTLHGVYHVERYPWAPASASSSSVATVPSR